METDQAIRTRRTHKAFVPEPVARETLDSLFDLARWAPNHHVTNPWRFRVLGPASREALIALADSRQEGAGVKLQRAPTLVAVSSVRAGDEGEQREDLLATAVAAYLVLLGAHARGLAGYWRTVGLLDEPEGREILGLPDGEEPLGLLYLGTPVQEQRVPERAPVADVVEYLA
jgi:nitroreductase